MKVSGALKRLINRINAGFPADSDLYPQNYSKALEKIEIKRAFVAARPEREAKRQAKKADL